MKIDLSRFRDVFFDETLEHLTTMESGLLRLELTPDDAELVHDVFRAIHSIKGGAVTLGFSDIGDIAHAMESLLDRLRQSGLRATPKLIDVLLRARDLVAALVLSARQGTLPPSTLETIRNELRQALEATEKPIVDTTVEAANPMAVAPSSGQATFAISFLPEPTFFQKGLDPLLLLRELGGLGTIIEVQLHDHTIPPLDEMDPTTSYLSWSILLKTDAPRSAIEEVFEFASDVCTFSITQPTQEHIPEKDTDDARGFFGSFLVRHGMLAPEQILTALDHQAKLRPLLGRVALETGKMSVAEIFDTLNQMGTLGLRFGESAVHLGYLPESDLRELLLKQKCIVPLGEVLVRLGYLSNEQLTAALEAFKHEPVSDECELLQPAQASCPDSPPTCGDLSQLNPEMLAGFCSEAEEHLESIDRNLLVLDANPTCKETLNGVYRAFHSIKGVASMFDLLALVALAHEAENLLNAARDGTLELRGQFLDLAFASADGLKRQVGYLRNWLATGTLPDTDPNLPTVLAQLQTALGRRPKPGNVATLPAAQETPPVQDQERSPEGRPPATGEKETVRVDRSRLDKLINSIGELVIAQSMVQQEIDDRTAGEGFHSRALPELYKIARDLQELSLSLRMVPLSGTFQKVARIVRDLSKKIGKAVHFQVFGEETELDKTVVDRLGDPLVHMVRNAIDHGIEPREVRIAAGKPAEGTITLRGFHRGGNVHIELTDDGKGLDRQAILAKATEHGLISDGQTMTDSEVFALIFEPGFSTAKVVTDISGRGVGMDVVRRNVEALQGSIQIRSQVSKGTTFTIRLPLTLAIMDGLSVSLRDEVYILPLLSVIESFQPRAADIHTVAGLGEVVVVRGETVPLLRLHRLLGRPARVTDPRRGLLVLVENQGKKYALLVDELLGQLQVVMKSLDVNFQKVEGIAGATILGDGRVAMILDVFGLIRLAEHAARSSCTMRRTEFQQETPT